MPITTPAGLLGTYGDDRIHFQRVARHLFKPAAEAAGYSFKAPASTSAEVIQAEIIQFLQEADLVLCDISSWNANVFFELGIRVALDKPVAMVRDSATEEIPFDTAIVNCHTYEAGLEVWRVEEEIPKLTDFLKSAGSQTRNALWKYFGITQRAEQSDVGSPEDAKYELLLNKFTSLEQSVLGKASLSRTSPVQPHKANAYDITDQYEISEMVQRLLPDISAATVAGNALEIFSEATLQTSVTDHVARLLREKLPFLQTVKFYSDGPAPYRSYNAM